MTVSAITRQRTIRLAEFEILLAEPFKVPAAAHTIPRENILESCRCAWGMERGEGGRYRLSDSAHAMSFRLEGPVGSGKNELVYQLARELSGDLYMQSGHEEMGPEDLALLLIPDRRVRRGLPLTVHASPLATALLLGGLFLFDEIHRVPERTLATLSSVLDDRHGLFSTTTGTWIRAVDEATAHSFRFCCTLESDGRKRLPPYIEQRTTPAIEVPPLGAKEICAAVLWESCLRDRDFLLFAERQFERRDQEITAIGEFRQAELVERLVALRERDFRRRFNAARTAASEARWEDAAAEFSDLAAELPEGCDLWRNSANNRAHSMMELGRLEEALCACEGLLRRAVDFPVGVCTLADIHERLSQCAISGAERRRHRTLACTLYRRVAGLETAEDYVRRHAESGIARLGCRSSMRRQRETNHAC